MAAQNEETQKIAIDRYSDDEDNHHKFPAHFGTHYSTSAYVYYYLMREEPFTTLLTKLQGYKQENPDRMFYSIDELLSVLSGGHDNRELIPDLFFKIEHFINLNCNNFGTKIGKIRVDDFIVDDNYNDCDNNDNNDNNNNNDSDSGDNDSDNDNKLNKDMNNKREINQYIKFVIDNRKLLDDSKISININEWIDIIFGVGQLPDKNKKKSFNIYYKETYEQKTDLYKKIIKFKKNNKNDRTIEDLIQKISNKIDLIIAFGQTPYQLFIDKHPKFGKKVINTE